MFGSLKARAGQDREAGVFGEARVGFGQSAHVEHGATVGGNDAGVLTGGAESDIVVFRHDSILVDFFPFPTYI